MSKIHEVVLKLLYGIETERKDEWTDKLISKRHLKLGYIIGVHILLKSIYRR